MTHQDQHRLWTGVTLFLITTLSVVFGSAVMRGDWVRFVEMVNG